MTSTQWNYFSNFRNNFKNQCEKWTSQYESILRPIQEKLASENKPPYLLENPIVYNTDLDKITENDEIKLIVIGDNPGKNEQLNCNKKYLCGLSGKIGENFFKNNPELDIDFRKNVIILNKTPVHTAKTTQLKCFKSNPELWHFMEETEIFMAEETAKLQKFLNLQIWIVGYSELKPNGLFTAYTSTLSKFCNKEELFVFQHFSMNRFQIDLRDFSKENADILTVKENLQKLGTLHRKQFFPD